MTSGSDIPTAGRTGETGHHHRRFERRGDAAPTTLLLGQFCLMVDQTTGIDIHAKRSRTPDVIIDPGISADPHTDPPAVHIDCSRPSSGHKIPLLVPAQIRLAVRHRGSTTVEAHCRNVADTIDLNRRSNQRNRICCGARTYQPRHDRATKIDRRRIQRITRQGQLRKHHQLSLGLLDQLCVRGDIPAYVTVDNSRLRSGNDQILHHHIVTGRRISHRTRATWSQNSCRQPGPLDLTKPTL